MAVYYAICILVGTLGVGSMFQSNQAYVQFVNVTGADGSFFDQRGWLFGLILAVLVGAVIVGGAAGELAEIVGFATGFLSPRVGALRRIERLVFKGNRVDGFLLRGNGVIAEELTARTNGRDGIRVMGRGGRFTDLRAENNRGSGLRFETRDAIVEGTSSGNLKHGLLLSGSGNDVSAVIARENGGYGAILRGRDQNSAGLVSEDNSKSTPRRAVEERGR